VTIVKLVNRANALQEDVAGAVQRADDEGIILRPSKTHFFGNEVLESVLAYGTLRSAHFQARRKMMKRRSRAFSVCPRG
jgi:hypothetical protein